MSQFDEFCQISAHVGNGRHHIVSHIRRFQEDHKENGSKKYVVVIHFQSQCYCAVFLAPPRLKVNIEILHTNFLFSSFFCVKDSIPTKTILSDLMGCISCIFTIYFSAILERAGWCVSRPLEKKITTLYLFLRIWAEGHHRFWRVGWFAWERPWIAPFTLYDCMGMASLSRSHLLKYTRLVVHPTLYKTRIIVCSTFFVVVKSTTMSTTAIYLL